MSHTIGDRRTDGTDGSVVYDAGADAGGEVCGASVCSPGTHCCGRFGCFTGGCPPLPGGDDAGVDCGGHVCPVDQYCCNASCGICAAAGTSCVALECVDAGEPGPPDAGPRVCGTIAGITCAGDEYCDYGGDASCGGDDGGGTCQPRPGECPENFDPVCGCDRRTYPNACDAESNGVGVSRAGRCAMPTPARDCLSDGCPSGDVCQLCWGHYACVPSGAIC